MPYDLCNLDEQTEQKELTQVQGAPFAIGAGFNALSFKHTMYAGAMDPLIMVDHFTMTASTFGPHAHAGLSAVSILFEDSEGVFNARDSLGNDVGQGYRARLVLGESNGMKGAKSPALPMTIVDVNLEAGALFEHQMPSGQSAWLLGIDGAIGIRNGDATASLKSGASVSIRAQHHAQDLTVSGNSKAHFVILQAEPLREPFVQGGPFAMTTEKEVEAMFAAHAAGELGSLDDL